MAKVRLPRGWERAKAREVLTPKLSADVIDGDAEATAAQGSFVKHNGAGHCLRVRAQRPLPHSLLRPDVENVPGSVPLPDGEGVTPLSRASDARCASGQVPAFDAAALDAFSHRGFLPSPSRRQRARRSSG